MIKSFEEFINESVSNTPNSSKYASDVINLLQKVDDSGESYVEIRELEYNEEDHFDLVIQVKKSSKPDFESDEHFHDLPWEEINFEHYGFALDANTYIDKGDLTIPEIVISLIINPNEEPKLYKELNYKLIDIITHELNHTKQVGWNREPFNIRPSSNPDRKNASHAAAYFLLPDEVESMVAGMYERSKAQGVQIDKIMDKYLVPFLMDKQITREEYLRTLEVWIRHTLENYPDAELSMEDEKIRKIVHSV